MAERRQASSGSLLWVVILLATAYGGLLYTLRTLTGSATWDGILGVILGLYVCSHPAANVLDTLIFGRTSLRSHLSGWRAIAWVALNAMAFVVGFLAIYIGVMRFTTGAP